MPIIHWWERQKPFWPDTLQNYPIKLLHSLFSLCFRMWTRYTHIFKPKTHIFCHTFTCTCTPCEHLELLWGACGRASQMGSFKETSYNIHHVVHNGCWRWILARTYHILSICVAESEWMCGSIRGTFVCTDIYMWTGTQFKSLNSFFSSFFLYSYHL